MFENPRKSRQARNFTTNVPKILDLKSSSEQIFFRKLSLSAPGLRDRAAWEQCFQGWQKLNSYVLKLCIKKERKWVLFFRSTSRYCALLRGLLKWQHEIKSNIHCSDGRTWSNDDTQLRHRLTSTSKVWKVYNIDIEFISHLTMSSVVIESEGKWTKRCFGNIILAMRNQSCHLNVLRGQQFF